MDVPAATSGESFTVSALLTCDGDIDTQVVAFRIDTNGGGNQTDETALASTEFELSAASNGSVNVSAVAPDVAPGEYDFALVTPAFERAATLDVYRPTGSSSSAPAPITREDIAQALYGTTYDDLDQAWQVEDVYDRLPLPSGTSLSEFETIEEITQRLYEATVLADSRHKYDEDQYTLTPGQAVIVRNTYDSQFGPLPSRPEYLSQAVYTQDFADLDANQAIRIQMLYSRQPFAAGRTSAAVDTLRGILIDNIRDEGRSDVFMRY
jgi:hypothetical protein